MRCEHAFEHVCHETNRFIYIDGFLCKKCGKEKTKRSFHLKGFFNAVNIAMFVTGAYVGFAMAFVLFRIFK